MGRLQAPTLVDRDSAEVPPAAEEASRLADWGHTQQCIGLLNTSMSPNVFPKLLCHPENISAQEIPRWQISLGSPLGADH